MSSKVYGMVTFQESDRKCTIGFSSIYQYKNIIIYTSHMQVCVCVVLFLVYDVTVGFIYI